MATRFEQRFAQTTLRPRTAARDWRAALGDAGFRRRLHGVAFMMVSVVGVSTGLLVTELGSVSLVGMGMGVYGLYLWRR